MHYSWFQHQREGVSQAHTEIRTLWVSEKMMQGRGGGCRSRDEGTGVVGEVEDRWHSSMVPTCWWGSGLRTERYIYIFGVLPHLESTPLGRVEHQEAFEEVLAVCGHVEWDAVLPSEHTLPQLLHRGGPGSQHNTSTCNVTYYWSIEHLKKDFSLFGAKLAS